MSDAEQVRWDPLHAKWIPALRAPNTPRTFEAKAVVESYSKPVVESGAVPNGRIAYGGAVGGIFPGAILHGKRMYQTARPSRLTSDWQVQNSSSDSELVSSLIRLRGKSRALVRDSAYAKRAKMIVVNNVVGAGIGMQAKVYTTRNALNERVNDDIEQVWERWCKADACHTGGTLNFAAFERAAMGQVFEAGEVIIRKHYSAFGNSKVPYALELIEAERIADTLSEAPTGPTSPPLPGNWFRLGIEVDSFYRPVAYWLYKRHPGEVFIGEGNWNRLERVPADQIIHLKVTDRWPQGRGEPWLHAVARKLNDMDGYSEAEIVAARGAASYMGSIETPEGSSSIEGEEQVDGTQQLELTPGIFEKLAPGEKMNFFAPNRPNSALDPFMRYMLREVAAGVGVSYESLSRDYSQSNYSSSRLALLDDRDLWRVLQGWFIKSFREQVHAEWLRQAVFAGALRTLPVTQYASDPETFGESVAFKPRGWSWIDPTKEVEAYREAVRCGFMTVSGVIARTGDGMDLEDLLDERRQELDDMAAKKLLFDTDPALAVARPTATTDQPAAPAEAGPPSESASAPVGPSQGAKSLREQVYRALGQALSDAEMRGEARGREDQTAEALSAIGRAIEGHPAPVVNITPQPINVAAPIVNVEAARAPEVNIAPPNITIEPAVVNMKAARAPDVHVAAPIVNIEPAQITVAATPGKVSRTVTEWTADGLPKTVEETTEHAAKRTRTVTEWTPDGMPAKVEEIDG